MSSDVQSLSAQLSRLNERNKRLEEKNKQLIEKESVLLSRLSRLEDEKSISLTSKPIRSHIVNELSGEAADSQTYALDRDIELKQQENQQLKDENQRLQAELAKLEKGKSADDGEDEAERIWKEVGDVEAENRVLAKAVFAVLNNPRVLVAQDGQQSHEEMQKVERDLLDELHKENRTLKARAEILRRQNEELHEFVLAHFDIQKVNQFYNFELPSQKPLDLKAENDE